MRLVHPAIADPGRSARPRRRGTPRPDTRIAVERGFRVAATTAALVAGLVLVGAGTGRTFFFDDDRERVRPELEQQFRERLEALRGNRRTARGEGADLPGWLDAAMAAVVVLVVLLVSAALLYGLYRGLRALRALVAARLRPGVVPEAYDPGESSGDDAPERLRRRLREQFAAGALDVDPDVDAREAVIACYQRMERAVAAAGTARLPHETPEELLARVLAAHDVPQPSIERLTALYEEARYSVHVVDDDMREAARRCLEDVRAAV